ITSTNNNAGTNELLSLPIRTINFDDPGEVAVHDRVVGLVEKMIEAKKTLADARTDKDREFYERYCENLDSQIDDLVYQLYDITPEERKIIEGK
ncbi:MAG TPA: hypothetical protein PLK77_08880, partial [Pyrinomonadaceae bacterium]|nr:hypothetical protein [Pyrinomonadaceae bacterium]